MNPKVSVIVPCYKVEKYLDRCVESLVNQTLCDIEIILIDDGSPDCVPQMCDDWAAKDSRIRVVHKKNAGLGYARNSGLDIATGEYVAFVDSDDFVDVEMYKVLYDKAKETDSDAIFCGFRIESRHGIWKESQEVEIETHWKGESVKDFMLDMVASPISYSQERRYYMSVWHAIYRLDIIQKNNLRFLSERDVASEDIPFQIDFLSKSYNVRYVPDNLYYYCLNKTSLTATYKSEKYDRFKYLYSIIGQKLLNYPDGQNRANRFFIGYTRTQLHHLMKSNYPHKWAEITRIVTDPIWLIMKKEYPITYYSRMNIRLMYWLILNRRVGLLYLNSKVINLVKSLRQTR